MSNLIVNDTTIETVIVNGTECDKVICNGTTVFEEEQLLNDLSGTTWILNETLTKYSGTSTGLRLSDFVSDNPFGGDYLLYLNGTYGGKTYPVLIESSNWSGGGDSGALAFYSVSKYSSTPSYSAGAVAGFGDAYNEDPTEIVRRFTFKQNQATTNEDATNPDLIAWFLQNATQIKE